MLVSLDFICFSKTATWKSSLSHSLRQNLYIERAFDICVNIAKLSWSGKEELAGFPQRIQGFRGSGFVLDHLNLHAQLQTSASSESEKLLPSSGSGFWSVSLETGRKKDLSTLITHNAVSHLKNLPLISGGILVVGRHLEWGF